MSPTLPAPAQNSGRTPIESWGRITVAGEERRGEDLVGLSRDVPLSRGLGRSYGDSSLPPPGDPRALNTVLADRLLAFDPKSGLLRAEAGFSLRELYRVFLKRGWFTPVSPGTSFVTLGGMVASDVHGKSHHCDGTFGEYVTRLKLRLADGRIVECSMEEEQDLFLATIGGMGLTGHILEVEVPLRRVPSPWIYQESERIPNIDKFMDRLHETQSKWPMTVGWIDCLSRGEKMGRGHLMAGRWAEPHEAPKRFPRQLPRISLPFDLPPFVLSRRSVQIFNELVYWKQIREKVAGIVHPEVFFYPLDAILHWNRAYGRRGLTQYQAVLPTEGSRKSVRAFMELLSSRGGASFLCVIKDCGAEGRGILSFPKPGVSVALDIQITDQTQGLVDALNEFVIGQGGRIYLTKDQFTRPEHFRAMEPRLERFLEIRRRYDPELKIRSAQSVRLFGDPP
jgi:decaprenylphospho-beta-D-ribofuranose 2-oxidase